MEIKNIATFVKIAECNNFTKAAEMLGYSQSAVTVQIKSLESELGVPLFDRIGKRVNLTEEGKTFLPYAVNLLEAEQKALQSVKPSDELVGELKICSASSYAAEVLPSILLDFKTAHPNVNITIKVSDYFEDTLRYLSLGEIDFLLCLGTENAYPGFLSTKAVNQPLSFLTHKNNGFPKKKNSPLSEVVGKDFISSDRGIGYFALLEKELSKRNIDFQPGMDIGSARAIVKILCQGYGVSFLPEYVAKDALDSGTLMRIPTELNLEMYSYFLYNKNRWVNPIMAAFVELCNNL